MSLIKKMHNSGNLLKIIFNVYISSWEKDAFIYDFCLRNAKKDHFHEGKKKNELKGNKYLQKLIKCH